MRFLAALLALIIILPALPVSAADAVLDVRTAETGFAKAFADRDKVKFFSYVADDAVFLNPLGTLRGKPQIIERWSRFFDGVAEAPFQWGPERVEVTGDGRIGFSMGPIYLPNGEHAGYYSSVWQKQGDGTWKVIVDGPGNPPPHLASNAAPFEEGFVPTPDGVKLHYRKLGEGPVTLIVPLDFALYDVMKQFADIATVITYDLRSRGRSSRAKDVETLTIRQDVADLETVRAHFKAEKFVPVGFSYLGKMVMLYTAAHPDRVRRVVQLAPVANVKESTPAPQMDFGAAPADIERWQKMLADGSMQKTPREFCLAQWQVLRFYMVGNPKHAPNFAMDEMCTLENEWPVNANVALSSVMASVEKASLSAEELKKVTMPVLTIHGTSDRNAPYSGGRAWAAQLPDARLVTVPGGAHAVWLDDPVTTFGAMRHFLRGEWPVGSEQVTP
jgi:proline iminopeptidase